MTDNLTIVEDNIFEETWQSFLRLTINRISDNTYMVYPYAAKDEFINRHVPIDNRILTKDGLEKLKTLYRRHKYEYVHDTAMKKLKTIYRRCIDEIATSFGYQTQEDVIRLFDILSEGASDSEKTYLSATQLDYMLDFHRVSSAKINLSDPQLVDVTFDNESVMSFQVSGYTFLRYVHPKQLPRMIHNQQTSRRTVASGVDAFDVKSYFLSGK